MKLKIPKNPTVLGKPVTAREWMASVLNLAASNMRCHTDDTDAKLEGLIGALEGAWEMAIDIEEGRADAA